MVKTYTALKVDKNHDWDFSVDSDGNITELTIEADVHYGGMVKNERLDIWPVLSDTQKTKIQRAYDDIGTYFDSQFIS